MMTLLRPNRYRLNTGYPSPPDVPDARDACVQRLTRSLQHRDGIDEAHVVDAASDTPAKLCIHYDPEAVPLSRIRQIAQSLGAHAHRPVRPSRVARQGRPSHPAGAHHGRPAPQPRRHPGGRRVGLGARTHRVRPVRHRQGFDTRGAWPDEPSGGRRAAPRAAGPSSGGSHRGAWAGRGIRCGRAGKRGSRARRGTEGTRSKRNG